MTTIKTTMNGVQCIKRLARVESVEPYGYGAVMMTVCYKRKLSSREVHSFLVDGASVEELNGKVLWVILQGTKVIGIEAMPFDGGGRVMGRYY